MPEAGTPLRVVGQDTTATTAQLWESTDAGSSWTAYDVNNLIGTCSGNWIVRRGDDVNSSGWIVALGQRSTEFHPLLLEPITTCRWDLTTSQGDPDGVVSTIDFLTLLTSWGPCPSGLPCEADFDCSESVSTADFLELLTHWGPCGQAPAGPPQTIQDCINRFGTEDVLLLEHCICAVEPDECPEE